MSATTVNVPNVKAGVTESLREIARQENSLVKISDEINFMENAWDSDTQRAYADKFRTVRAEMDKLNQSTKEYLSMMRSFVDDCVSTDSQAAKAFGGITF